MTYLGGYVPPVTFTQRAFFAAVQKELGKTTTEIGELVGEKNAYSQSRAFEIERIGLGYARTMKMLIACGWLTKDALQALAEQERLLAEEEAVQAEGIAGAKRTPRSNGRQRGTG